MSAVTTKRGIGFDVNETEAPHRDEFGPIAFSMAWPAHAHYFQTYLTADEAAELGAALSAAALKFDIEVLSKAALTPWKEPEA